uniref:Uncharacterized protein n=1 Tax=Ciona intestinalis TaxID=7719 RepID=H2XQ33_CIOIN
MKKRIKTNIYLYYTVSLQSKIDKKGLKVKPYIGLPKYNFQ